MSREKKIINEPQKNEDGENEMTSPETPKNEIEETAKETAIVKDTPETVMNSAIAAIGKEVPKFLENYRSRIERVAMNYPTMDTLAQILLDLPDDLADKLEGITQGFGGEIQGIYTAEQRPDFPELKLFQGTGNDSNRPEKQIPGEFYLSSKVNVGESFTGAVLLIVEGRTMWGDRSADGDNKPRVPLCNSLDRKIGSTYGDCETCPNRPWHSDPPRCANDIVAYMLRDDLSDIVKVRFQKTSESAGRRLMRFLRSDKLAWKCWYTISAHSRVNSKDSNIKWHVMDVERRAKNTEVPKELHPFCSAMCTALEGTMILPALAGIYRNASDSPQATDSVSTTGSVDGLPPADSESMGDI